MKTLTFSVCLLLAACVTAEYKVKAHERKYVRMCAPAPYNPSLPAKMRPRQSTIKKEPTKKMHKNFQKWLDDELVIYRNKLEIAWLTDEYRAIRSTKSIPRNENVIFVPDHFIMLNKEAENSNINLKINELSPNKKFSTHSTMALYLLEQLQYGKDSFWKRYIDILPSTLPTNPIFFDDDLLAELKGSLAHKNIIHYLYQFRSEYEFFVEKHKHLTVKYDDYVWARLIVATRAFTIQKHDKKYTGLVPMADMLNHKNPAHVTWGYNTTAEGFYMRALRRIPANTEVHASYGMKAMHEYFAQYGFVPAEHRIQIMFDLPSSDEFFDIKKELINGTHVSCKLELDLNSADGKQRFESCRDFIRVMVANSEEELAVINKYVADRKSALSDKKFVSPDMPQELELRVWQMLRACTGRWLGDYPTTIEEDEEIMAKLPTGWNRVSNKISSIMDFNRHNVLTLRRNEKRILKSYHDWAASKLRLDTVNPPEPENKQSDDDANDNKTCDSDPTGCKPSVFDEALMDKKKFYNGVSSKFLRDLGRLSRVDALDYLGFWYTGEIRQINPTTDELLVHFDQWDKRFDEWIKRYSGKLAPSKSRAAGGKYRGGVQGSNTERLTGGSA